MFRSSLRALTLTLAIPITGCMVGDGGPPELSADPGVIFSYPHDDQRDVPGGARLVLSFTDPVDVAALVGGCTLDGGRVRGGLCVRGPDGLVPAETLVMGPRDNVIHFESPGWTPGATYEVFASPSLLWDRASNLPESEPLLRFTAAQPDQLGSAPPAVLSVNGDDPAAFATGGGGAPHFPFIDFNTIRLTFSEPLAESTIVYGESLRLVDGAGALVPAAVLVDRAHVTVDPVADLMPDRTYRLALGSSIRDLGGDALAATELSFLPRASRVDGRELAQVLSCTPGTEQSYAAGTVINQVSVAAPLIGDSELSLADSTLTAVMGNPAGFGPLIPLSLRRGQRMTLEALPIRLGGEIATTLSTGPLAVQLASDATVYLTRNPFRDPGRLPDDELAPVHAYLALDLVVTAADPGGNAVLNQHVLSIQATGLARIHDEGLAIDSVGALELDLLGLDRATSNMVLRLRTTTTATAPTDANPPEVSAAEPADGARGVATDASLRVTFSEAIDPASVIAPGAVTLLAGAAVPIQATVLGSTVVIRPRGALAFATDHTLDLSGITDLAGRPLPRRQLRFRTRDLTTAEPMPLTLAAASPGVPCALEGATAASPGRCRDGDGDDDAYAPFTLPADQAVELAFQQPLDRATVTLGAACGAGAVRVERLDTGGACIGTVRGRLQVGERSLRFVPDGGWASGTRYRVVLHAGSDEDCDAGELCGLNRMPLNSDVLNGIADRDDAGGADVMLPFTAAGPDRDRYPLLTRAWPVADTNGNGYVDAGEQVTATNRAAMVIKSTSGMVRSASLDGADCVASTPAREACMYLSGTLPVTMGQLAHDCDVGGVRVPACIPVAMSPQILYGTSLSMDAEVAVVGSLSDQRTEQLVLRMRAPAGQPVTGYIVAGANGKAELRARLPMYLDAPSMRLLAGLAGHDLHSKPMTVDLVGPVTFTPDGRIQIDVANVAAVPLEVRVSAIGIGIGSIAMEIPAGQLVMRLVGDSPKEVW